MAISFMRLASATYSSRKPAAGGSETRSRSWRCSSLRKVIGPGGKRPSQAKAEGRSNVAGLACRFCPPLAPPRNALLRRVARDAAELGEPWPRRAAPDLLPRRQAVALTQDTDAYDVHFLRSVAGRRRIDRRAALRAKGLRTRIAAVGGSLQIHRRPPGD